MIIKNVSFQNYRNLINGSVSPCEGVNVICGDNAQGKTNFLECLWLFTGGKSFRGSRDSDLITFGEKTASINLNIFSEERLQNFQLNFIQKKRSVFVNKVRLSVPSQLVGKVCAVVFSPSHLALVKDGPGLRRKFLDTAICQIRPLYASVLLKYNHILHQRNSLLRAIKKDNFLINTLDVWEDNLAHCAAFILAERFAYIQNLFVSSQAFYSGLSAEKETLSLQYKPTSPIDPAWGKDEIKKNIKDVLRSSRDEDISLGFTTKGPHRDDLDLKINEKSAKNFASQGQQRSIVLALKLAEADILSRAIGQEPIILFDDVLSELDAYRQNYILNRIGDKQVFITCCSTDLNEKLSEGKLFYVHQGSIQEQN